MKRTINSISISVSAMCFGVVAGIGTACATDAGIRDVKREMTGLSIASAGEYVMEEARPVPSSDTQETETVSNKTEEIKEGNRKELGVTETPAVTREDRAAETARTGAIEILAAKLQISDAAGVDALKVTAPRVDLWQKHELPEFGIVEKCVEEEGFNSKGMKTTKMENGTIELEQQVGQGVVSVSHWMPEEIPQLARMSLSERSAITRCKEQDERCMQGGWRGLAARIERKIIRSEVLQTIVKFAVKHPVAAKAISYASVAIGAGLTLAGAIVTGGFSALAIGAAGAVVGIACKAAKGVCKAANASSVLVQAARHPILRA